MVLTNLESRSNLLYKKFVHLKFHESLLGRMEKTLPKQTDGKHVFSGEEILECFKESISSFEHDLLHSVTKFTGTLTQSLEQYFLNNERCNLNSSEFSSSNKLLNLKQSTEHAVDLKHETKVKQLVDSTTSLDLHPTAMRYTHAKSIDNDQPSKVHISKEDVIIKDIRREGTFFAHPSSTEVSVETCLKNIAIEYTTMTPNTLKTKVPGPNAEQSPSTGILHNTAQPSSIQNLTSAPSNIAQPSSTEISNNIAQRPSKEIDIETQIPTKLSKGIAQPSSTEVATDIAVSSSNEIPMVIEKQSATFTSELIVQPSSAKVSTGMAQTPSTESTTELSKVIAQPSSTEVSTDKANQYPNVLLANITAPPSSAEVSTGVANQLLVDMPKVSSTQINYKEISLESRPNSLNQVVLRNYKGRQQKVSKILDQSLIIKTTPLNFAPGTIKTMNDGTLVLCQTSKRYQASTVVPYLCLMYQSGETKDLQLEGEALDIAVHPYSDELYCIMSRENSISKIDITTGKTTKIFDAEGISISFAHQQNSTAILVLIGSSKNLIHSIHVYTHNGVKLQTFQCKIQPQHLCVCKYTGKIGISAGRDGVQILDSNFDELYRQVNNIWHFIKALL